MEKVIKVAFDFDIKNSFFLNKDSEYEFIDQIKKMSTYANHFGNILNVW